jgi:hypothetical protein
MTKSRPAAPAATTEWARWTIQLPPTLIWDLKVAAAQNRQPIREALRTAVEAYCDAAAQRAE